MSNDLNEILALAGSITESETLPAKPVKRDPLVGPMMPLDTMTYVQVSFWDNKDNVRETPTGRKSGAPRFKITIEAWDVPADRLRKTPRGMQFKRNVQLRSAKEFGIMIDGALKRATFTKDYHKALDHWIANSAPGSLFGHIVDREGGWNYHMGQLVRVTLDDTNCPTLEIIINGESMVIDGFTDQFAKGFVTHTAYKDLCNYQQYKRENF
jgi:hypothetical protein